MFAILTQSHTITQLQSQLHTQTHTHLASSIVAVLEWVFLHISESLPDSCSQGCLHCFDPVVLHQSPLIEIYVVVGLLE